MDGIFVQVIVSGLLLGGVYARQRRAEPDIWGGAGHQFRPRRPDDARHVPDFRPVRVLENQSRIYQPSSWSRRRSFWSEWLFSGCSSNPLQNASALMLVFSTFGLSIALQNLVLMGFKADYRTILICIFHGNLGRGRHQRQHPPACCFRSRPGFAPRPFSSPAVHLSGESPAGAG